MVATLSEDVALVGLNELHYGVVVGINRYPGIRDLQHARHDAEQFKNWLTSPTGGRVPEGNVHLIAASEEEESTFANHWVASPKRANVHRALDEVNRRVREQVQMNPDRWESTRLYLFVAGHGIAPRGADGALLMADARHPGMLGENIELSLYTKWYVECGLFHELVVLADCCRERLPGMPNPSPPPFDTCETPARKTVLVVGYAAGLGEQAFEPEAVGDPNQARGFFTRAVLDGLQWAPVDPATGKVTAATLGPYVKQKVREMTKDLSSPQEAMLVGDMSDSVTFGGARGGLQPDHPITIHLPADYVHRVVLRDGAKIERARWGPGEASFGTRLEDGFYRVLGEDGSAEGLFNGGYFTVTTEVLDVRL